MNIQKLISESKSTYEIYHSSYSNAITEAEKYAKKNGFDLDDEELADKIGLGPGKPKSGKTTKHSINLYKGEKKQRKMLQIQIYNRETKINTYELNMYIG